MPQYNTSFRLRWGRKKIFTTVLTLFIQFHYTSNNFLISFLRHNFLKQLFLLTLSVRMRNSFPILVIKDKKI